MTYIFTWQFCLLNQMVKNMATMQENRVRSLGPKDSLEKGIATHSSIPAWRIPWREEPGRLQSTGSQRVGHEWSNWACTQAKRMSTQVWLQTWTIATDFYMTLHKIPSGVIAFCHKIHIVIQYCCADSLRESVISTQQKSFYRASAPKMYFPFHPGRRASCWILV